MGMECKTMTYKTGKVTVVSSSGYPKVSMLHAEKKQEGLVTEVKWRTSKLHNARHSGNHKLLYLRPARANKKSKKYSVHLSNSMSLALHPSAEPFPISVLAFWFCSSSLCCWRMLTTSFAETKKTRFLAVSSSTTFSSLARNPTSVSRCCSRTYIAEDKGQKSVASYTQKGDSVRLYTGYVWGQSDTWNSKLSLVSTYHTTNIVRVFQ